MWHISMLYKKKENIFLALRIKTHAWDEMLFRSYNSCLSNLSEPLMIFMVGIKLLRCFLSTNSSLSYRNSNEGNSFTVFYAMKTSNKWMYSSEFYINWWKTCKTALIYIKNISWYDINSCLDSDVVLFRISNSFYAVWASFLGINYI